MARHWFDVRRHADSKSSKQRGVAGVPSFTSALQRSGVAYVTLADPYMFEQTLIWREPFSSTCVPRFVELAKLITPQQG
jgi:hypothetical protein